jgi:hypothetical protein
MHFCDVEVALYEMSLSRDPKMGGFSVHDFDRLELLYSCLRSAKIFFETLFSIPGNKYDCFSVPLWTQITHSIIVLHSLSSFDHPDWDLASVRREIDFVIVLDTLVERLNLAEGQIYRRIAEKTARLKDRLLQRMSSGVEGSGLEPLSGEDAKMGRSWDAVDFLDEDWLKDILGPMEFYDSKPKSTAVDRSRKFTRRAMYVILQARI